MKGSGFGTLMDIIIGIIGAIVGGYLFSLLGFQSAGGFIYTVFVAVIGAVILTWLIRLIKKVGGFKVEAQHWKVYWKTGTSTGRS
jgi:uncharacterized membrane protein YeaQ/YmgE (transglycosylase-associated protein family)